MARIVKILQCNNTPGGIIHYGKYTCISKRDKSGIHYYITGPDGNTFFGSLDGVYIHTGGGTVAGVTCC